MEKTNKAMDDQRALTLRVAEALPKDVGRGVVRLDPADIERLGAAIGDIVQISGKNEEISHAGHTVARVLPAFASERGRELAQIDGIIRENAHVSLDDIVQIQKIATYPARRVTLIPVYGSSVNRQQDARRIPGALIRQLLEGIPLVTGNRVRVTQWTRPLEFTVHKTMPDDAVIVTNTTDIRIEDKSGATGKDALAISYADIGGLGKELSRIREMIELPLRAPEIFERLGIAPPQGVLLHGPPGCGKTLIARAVAHETSAHFIQVAGPEVIHKFYGESEEHLRKIFEEAEAHAPAIIFLDEIDAIAPKREAVQGEVEKRVVAQLLALMDGLKARGRIMVIGATNIPNNIDPALRRPGRFDREISISVPDKTGRLEILTIHTRGMPLASDVDLDRLASMTHGFVGADLAALSREAAMSCVRQTAPVIELVNNNISYEKLLQLEVTMEHFLEALRTIEPTTIREVFTEIPETQWDQVGGLHNVKRLLRETVEWPITYADRFAYIKTTPPKGILLIGPPGTGKTLMARAVATESGVNFIAIKGPTLMSKWIGESEKGVREIFKKARQAAPCIVFFDEIDALIPIRGSGDGGSNVTERIVSQFLTELDGIEGLRNVMILGATNRPDSIDPALLRPGRFEIQVVFPLPDLAARLEIFKIHMRGKPLAEQIDLSKLAEQTESFTGAHLESICHTAAMLAIRDSVEREPGATFTDFKIEQRHIDAAMADMHLRQSDR